MRTTALGDVAQAADHDVPTSIRRVVVGRQRVMAVLAAVRNPCDGAVEAIVKLVGAEVKGPGRCIEGPGLLGPPLHAG